MGVHSRGNITGGLLVLSLILSGCLDDEKKVAAKITSQPESQLVLPDSTASFGVVATGSGTIRYQWMMGGVVMPGETRDSLRVASGYYDSIFTCIVNNGVGANTSIPVILYLGWRPEKSVNVGAQNSASGSAMDLDIPEAMQTLVAYAGQGSIDLLFAYSGNALKLMSPVAAKLAGDVSFASNFNASSINDVKFVKVPIKPTNQETGKLEYDSGVPINSAAVAAGDVFIVKTTGGKYAVLTVTSIQGSGATATANLAVSTGTL